MSLRERIKAAKPKQATIEVSGESFVVKGLTRSERNRIHSSCFSESGKLDTYKLEGDLLSACVLDPDSGEPVLSSASEWDEVPAEITGPLFSSVISINGFDADDIAKKAKDEAKNFDTTGS